MGLQFSTRLRPFARAWRSIGEAFNAIRRTISRRAIRILAVPDFWAQVAA
jgi:hypothetical protein